MHILWSVFFLICHMGLIITYILGILFLVTAVRAGFCFFNTWKKNGIKSGGRFAGKETAHFLRSAMERMQKSKFILFLFLLVLAINIPLYVHKRTRWMGEDNAHLSAKEYWVAGQVVFTFRSLYFRIGHPDDTVIQPFTWLQQWIYKKGLQYLPEEDGERGVWTDVWFVYPYSRVFTATMDTANGMYKPAPDMMALMDRAWFSLAQQAKFGFADRQMEKEHYFRNFPGQAFYYLKNKGFLTGCYMGSARLLTNTPRLINRDRQLIIWLEELKKKWGAYPEVQAFVRAHPKIEAIRRLTLQMEAGSLLRASLYAYKFSCDSKEVRDYLKFRSEFLDEGSTNPILLQIVDRDQARTLYRIGVNVKISRFWHYSLNRFCGLRVPGDPILDKFERDDSPERIGAVTLFNKEIKILKEICHDR